MRLVRDSFLPCKFIEHESDRNPQKSFISNKLVQLRLLQSTLITGFHMLARWNTKPSVTTLAPLALCQRPMRLEPPIPKATSPLSPVPHPKPASRQACNPPSQIIPVVAFIPPLPVLACQVYLTSLSLQETVCHSCRRSSTT